MQFPGQAAPVTPTEVGSALALDYTEFAELAEEEIAEAGRFVTLVQLGDTPTDPLKPWLGNTAARATPKRSEAVMAVFVEPSIMDKLGFNSTTLDFMKRSTQICMIYFDGPLGDFTELVDTDGSIWRVMGLTTLKPGATTLLHFVGVAR